MTERAHAGEEGRRRGGEVDNRGKGRVKKYRTGCRFSKKQNSFTFVQDVCFTASSKFTERVRDSRRRREGGVEKEEMEKGRNEKSMKRGKKVERKEETAKKRIGD